MVGETSTWRSRLVTGLIVGLIVVLLLSLVLVLPAMGLYWALVGPVPFRAWGWVYGALVGAVAANAVRHAFFPIRRGKPDRLDPSGG